MRLKKFDVNKERLKRNLKQNQNKRIKHLTISLSVFIIIVGIIAFSYAKFETRQEFRIVDAVVGEFNRTVDINFNGCGGTPSVSSKEYKNGKSYFSEGYNDGLPTSSKTGYNFSGWYFSCEEESEGVTNEDTVTKNITELYAHYTSKTINLILNLDGGSIEGNTSLPVAYGTPISLSTPTKTGYTFSGWSTPSCGTESNNTYTKGDCDNDVTITAQWTPVPYTLTVVQGCSLENKNYTINYGESTTIDTL